MYYKKLLFILLLIFNYSLIYTAEIKNAEEVKTQASHQETKKTKEYILIDCELDRDLGHEQFQLGIAELFSINSHPGQKIRITHNKAFPHKIFLPGYNRSG